MEYIIRIIVFFSPHLINFGLVFNIKNMYVLRFRLLYNNDEKSWQAKVSNSPFASWKWYKRSLILEGQNMTLFLMHFPPSSILIFHCSVSINIVTFLFILFKPKIGYLDFFHKLHMEKGMYSISTLKGRNGFPYILNYFFHTNSESLRITIKRRNKWICNWNLDSFSRIKINIIKIT